eukprot:811441_1
MPRNKTSFKSKIKKGHNKKRKQQKPSKMNHQNLSSKSQITHKNQNPQISQPILDKKSLFEKYNIHLGAQGYIPSKHNTPKSIHIQKVSLMNRGGSNQLLTNTQLCIKEAKHNNRSIYGLIGKNGSGKTTLLKAMHNYEIQGFPNHIRMLLVKQEESNNKNKNLLQSVLESDILRQQLLEIENKFSAMLHREICNIPQEKQPKSDSSVVLNLINDLLNIFDD